MINPALSLAEQVINLAETIGLALKKVRDAQAYFLTKEEADELYSTTDIYTINVLEHMIDLYNGYENTDLNYEDFVETSSDVNDDLNDLYTGYFNEE